MFDATACRRRLRFDIAMHEDESIPGAIARGVRAHVLFATRPVLIAADVSMKHIGHAQLAEPGQLTRLAHVARCEPNRFLSSAGAPVRHDGSSKSSDVRFGRLVLPRAYLELDRRRISPLTLRKSEYHRLDWMNLLLPYCPSSLEKLVDACGHCGSTLGWRHSTGIETCEHCDTEVAPATEAPLPDKLADDYGLFAALSSPSGGGLSDARAILPPPLRAIAPGTLVRLALLTGGLAQDEPVQTTDRLVVRRLSGPVLGAVVSTGTAMLCSWPTSFRRWTAERADRIADDREALRGFRSQLQRLTTRSLEGDDLTQLVADALPDLGSHVVHAFASDQRYYLYKQVQKTLGLDNPQIDKLRQLAGPAYRCIDPEAAHRRGRFDAGFVERLKPIFGGALAFNACTGRLRLPLYGVEQLCDNHLLERVGDPTFEVLKGRTSVTSDSLEDVVSRLRDARCGSIEPADAISLSMASRRIGGRAKPWASIFGALLSGETPFWLNGDAPTTMTIRVRPADLAAFDLIDDYPIAPWISPTISQADAAEMLNIKSAVVSNLAPGLGLPFTLSGRMLAADRNTVEHIAAVVAWDMEISWHLGVRFGKVEAALTARGIERLGTGWCRNTLIAEGILPRPTLSISRMTDRRVPSAAATGVRDYAPDCHAT